MARTCGAREVGEPAGELQRDARLARLIEADPDAPQGARRAGEAARGDGHRARRAMQRRGRIVAGQDASTPPAAGGPDTMSSAPSRSAMVRNACAGERSVTTSGRAVTPARASSASTRVRTSSWSSGAGAQACSATSSPPPADCSRAASASASRPPSRQSTPTTMRVNIGSSLEVGTSVTRRPHATIPATSSVDSTPIGRASPSVTTRCVTPCWNMRPTASPRDAVASTVIAGVVAIVPASGSSPLHAARARSRSLIVPQTRCSPFSTRTPRTATQCT